MTEDLYFQSHFIEVAKNKFWGVIYHHKLNVHPYPLSYRTEWQNLNDGTVFAHTTHGYMTSCHDPTIPPERFFISRRYAGLIESAPERNPKGKENDND